MKVIGITGMSGSGKTTLSNILEDKLNARVYHLDNVLESFKKNKLINKIFKVERNHEGRLILGKKAGKKIRKNKAFFVLREIVAIIMGKIIKKREIKKAKEEGKDYIIFEGSLLGRIFNENENYLNICMKRDYHKRKQSIEERDGRIDKDTLFFSDRGFHSRNKKVRFGIFIENNGDIEQLKDKVSKIIRESEDEKPINRYKLDETEIDYRIVRKRSKKIREDIKDYR